MLKTLKTLALTGLGYGATLLYTYAVLATADAETIGRLNKYESILTIITALISLGVVQDASRNIATSKSNWKEIYHEAQGIRISLSILISSASIIIFLLTNNELYLLGLASLAMALSGEYALYAIGRPIEGATASFFRAVSFSALMVIATTASNTNLNAATLTIAWSISFIACGVIASGKLGAKYFIPPGIASKKTLKTIGLIALLTFIYSNIKPAFILAISEDISKNENIYYFEAYKLYFILFSVRRIIVQSLYKEIITNKKSMKYDLIITCAMAASLCVLWSARIALDYLSISFPGLSYDVLTDVSVMTFMSCVFSSSFTRLFSLKKDLLITIPILITILFLYAGIEILSSINEPVSSFLYLLGAAELALSITSFIILRKYLATQ